MNILIVGDLHLQISKFTEAQKCLDEILSLVDEHKPNELVILGDVFHNHAILRSELLSTFQSFLTQIKTRKVFTKILVGNHDQYKPTDAKYTSLDTFKHFSQYVQIIDKPTILGNTTYFPFLNKDQLHLLKDPALANDIFFLHQSINSFSYGHTDVQNEIDRDQIKASIIISGHIHKAQHRDNVLYVGTPYASSADDIDEVKGYWLLNTDDLKPTFIPSSLPQYKSIKLKVEDLPTLPSLLDSQDHVYYVYIEGIKKEILHYLASSDFLDLSQKYNIRVKSTFTDQHKEREISIKTNKTMEIVQQYLTKVYKGTIDREVLLNEFQWYHSL